MFLKKSRFLNLRCAVCFCPLDDGILCPDCADSLAPDKTAVCPVCLKPLPITGKCGFCIEHARPWRKAAFYGVYEGKLRQILLAWKFGGELGYGRLLRNFLHTACELHTLAKPDLILPVPMSADGLLRRGYNQAWELCRGLNKKLGGRIAANMLQKIRKTQQQAVLSGLRRRKNLVGAFAVSPIAGKRILLVDDILTTGSTLEECAVTCLQKGAASVEVLVLART